MRLFYKPVIFLRSFSFISEHPKGIILLKVIVLNRFLNFLNLFKQHE